MGDAPYIVKLGSSNEAGFLALVADVPIEDMTRWLGAGGLHPPPPPMTSAQRPYEVSTPAVRMLTPRRPYSTNVGRSIVGISGGPGTLDYAGAHVDAPAGSWVYVRTNQSGQGMLAKVRVDPQASPACVWPFYRAGLNGGSAHRVLLDEPANPTTLLAAWPFYRGALLGGGREASLSEVLEPDSFGSWGTVHFLLDSSTLSDVSATKRKVTRAPTSAPFTEAVADRDVIFFFDNVVRRIVAWEPDAITLDQPINLSTWTIGVAYAFGAGVILDGVVYVCRGAHTSVAGVNEPAMNPALWARQPITATGFCVLTGADACETIGDLADTSKSSLAPIRFYFDEKAPVYLRGDDWCTYDATPFPSPTIGYFAGPTINDTFETAFHVISELEAPLVVVQLGISASMVSPFLQGSIGSPEPVSPFDGFAGWFRDIESLDFHPSSPSALWVALKNMITCAKAKIEAEGNTPRCAGVFVNLCDNDPADAQRVKRLGANLQQLLDATWAHIGEDDVPTILTGPSRYGGVAEQRAAIYAQLDELAAANKNVGVADTRQATEVDHGVFVAPDDYAVDLLHFSALGQIKKARVNTDAWKLVRARIAEPVVIATPPPLGPTDPQAIINAIDAAILAGGDIASYVINGRTVTLQGRDKLVAVRREYVAILARQQGLRRTKVRFGR